MGCVLSKQLDRYYWREEWMNGSKAALIVESTG